MADILKVRIQYTNLLQDSASIVTPSSETTGFEGSLAYNDRSYNGWLPSAAGASTLTVDLGSAKEVSAFCYARTTLADNGGTIALAYSDTGTGGPWTVMFAASTPTDERAVYRFTDTPETHRYWQVQVDSTPASQINLLSFGPDFVVDQGIYSGITPPFLQREDRVEANVTESGNFVGSSLISEECLLQSTYTHLSQDYIRDTWDPFRLHARTKAFWHLWNSVGRPTEAAWCYPTKGKFPNPSNMDWGFMQAPIRANCLPNVDLNT